MTDIKPNIKRENISMYLSVVVDASPSEYGILHLFLRKYALTGISPSRPGATIFERSPNRVILKSVLKDISLCPIASRMSFHLRHKNTIDNTEKKIAGIKYIIFT